MVNSSYMNMNSGRIRFKYYGEFDAMKALYEDCKDNLFYLGNSSKDAAPIFEYNYKGIDDETIKDFKKLNILLRKYKILKYMNKEMNKNEKSMVVFMKFFMYAYENNEIKNSQSWEVETKKYTYED